MADVTKSDDDDDFTPLYSGEEEVEEVAGSNEIVPSTPSANEHADDGAPQPGSDVSSLRTQVWFITNHKGFKGNKIALTKALFNYIWQQEVQEAKGTFIHSTPEGRNYLYSGATKRLYEIGLRNKQFTAYMWYRYGLPRTEPISQWLSDAFDDYCTMRGLLRTVHRWVHYDKRRNVLYISRYDGTCWRSSGTGWTIVNNGTECIFLDDDGGSHCPGVSIGDHGILLDRLVNGLEYVPATQSGLTPEQQRCAFAVWLFLIAFPDLMPTKPMLLIEGEPGSGKTVAPQLVQAVTHGRVKTRLVAKNDEKDFAVHILRSPIAHIDNVDNFVDWLQDALCAYATGGEWPRRKLWTDDDEYVIRPQSFIVISSANPVTFKREDVADRCLILRLRRRSQFTAPTFLQSRIENERPELLGEWLWYLDKIIAEIAGTHSVQADGEHRMADLTALARCIGRVIGYTDGDVDGMLHAMSSEREAFSAEGDTVVELLDRWLETRGNNGRQVTTAELHRELGEVAATNKINFKLTPNSLAQKLVRSKAVGSRYLITHIGMRGTSKVYTISPIATEVI